MFVVGGESLIDLVSQQVTPGSAMRLEAHQGGSPYNCAIALARLGNDSGFLCPISRDGFGDYLLQPLAAAGVTLLLGERVPVPTTLAVVTLDAQGRARYEFYRGADRALVARAGIAALPDGLDHYQIGGFCPIEPEDAETWLAVVEAAIRKGATVSIDPNVRPSLIADFDGYRQRLSAFLDLAHIVKVSDEDLAALDPSRSVAAHAAELLARPNCELVVVTLGERGSRAFTRSGEAETGIYSPMMFGDTVGAGDTLMAAVLTILRDRSDLDPARLAALDSGALAAVLRFGAVAAGLNCAQKGCKPPTRPEVERTLAELAG